MKKIFIASLAAAVSVIMVSSAQALTTQCRAQNDNMQCMNPHTGSWDPPVPINALPVGNRKFWRDLQANGGNAQCNVLHNGSVAGCRFGDQL